MAEDWPDLTPASAPSPSPADAGPNRWLLALGSIVVLALIGAVIVQALAGDDAQTVGEVEPSAAQPSQVQPSAGAESSLADAADAPSAAEEASAADAADGDVDAAGEERSVFELAIGDCYLSAEAVGELTTVDVVPCDKPHDDEVYHVLGYPAQAPGYPGQEALLTFGNRECTALPFTAYVGVEYSQSGYFTGVQAPSEESWEDGDRNIVCVLYDPRGQLEQSARGTAR